MYPAELKQLRNRTPPLNLRHEPLKLSRLIPTLDISLHTHFERNTLPIRIPLFATDQDRSRQHAFERDVPPAQLHAVVSGDDGAGDLVAGRQAVEGVRDGRRRRVFPAEGCVGVGCEGVGLALDGDVLFGAGAATGDLEGDGLVVR